MTASTTNQAIRAALRDHLGSTAGLAPEISDDADLLEVGAIASMDLLALVAFVNDRFAVEVERVDLYDGRFASVASIAALIEERT